LRASGQLCRAEHWLRRTRRLAVWTCDRVCEVRALSRLAEIAVARCRPDHAEELRRHADRVVKRHDLTLHEEIRREFPECC
jgi:hypothetical protein